MKKIKSILATVFGIGVLTGSALLGANIGENHSNEVKAEVPHVEVINLTQDDSGWTVLDMEGNVVVTEVVSDNNTGSDVVNVFDKEDDLFLDETYPKGTILLVEFDGDQIVSVKKNDLNIANKVIGQKIVD